MDRSPRKTPKFFYFDLGNVLLHFDHDVSCRNMAQLAEVSDEQVQALVFEGELGRRYERGQISSQQFYEAFCSQLLVEPELDALLHAAGCMFTVNTPVVPIVAQLRASGHRVGVLSNTCDAHWQYCLKHYAVVRDLFHVHALSFEMQSMKPEPEIYRRAADLARVAAEEIFFVDDLEANVQGAREAGFDAVLFESGRGLAEALWERGVRFNY